MSRWKEAVCSQDESLEALLQKVDAAGTQMGFVLDDAQKLVGIVSDGDVRRALLKGETLATPIKQVMNRNPKIANVNLSRGGLVALLNKHVIQQLPIVNDDGVLVDVVTKFDLSSFRKRENLVVIMAGGLGTRLMPLTENTPKPLIEIGGKPILETIIDVASEQGFQNFLIAVGYRGNMIEEFFGDGSEKGLRISYLREESSLGTAGALSLITEAPEQTFVVMNGDVLNRIDLDALIETREQQKAIIAIAARESETLIPYGVIEDAAGKLLSMVEKPTLRHLINTGVYACSPDLLSHCPHNEPLSMVDLIDRLLLAKIDVAVYRTDAYWLDIGQLEELDRAKREWKSFSDD
jgi:dTDP-glucose pyrophosphorylase